MEDRHQHLLLKLRRGGMALAFALLAVMAPQAWAQSDAVAADADKGADAGDVGIIPRVDRRVVKISDISSQDFEFGVSGGALSVQDFGTHGLLVGSATYHVTEDFFVEARYGTSKAGLTTYEELSGGPSLLTDAQRQVTFYDLSLGLNLFPGEAFVLNKRAFNSSFYLIGGLGATRFAGNDAFTVNAGAGYRLVLTSYLTANVQVRDHIFNTEITGTRKTTNNIEVSAGLAIFF